MDPVGDTLMTDSTSAKDQDAVVEAPEITLEKHISMVESQIIQKSKDEFHRKYNEKICKYSYLSLSDHLGYSP